LSKLFLQADVRFSERACFEGDLRWIFCDGARGAIRGRRGDRLDLPLFEGFSGPLAEAVDVVDEGIFLFYR
jgi:hypothetical protein